VQRRAAKVILQFIDITRAIKTRNFHQQRAIYHTHVRASARERRTMTPVIVIYSLICDLISLLIMSNLKNSASEQKIVIALG
jgi:hypothetical protein